MAPFGSATGPNMIAFPCLAYSDRYSTCLVIVARSWAVMLAWNVGRGSSVLTKKSANRPFSQALWKMACGTSPGAMKTA